MNETACAPTPVAVAPTVEVIPTYRVNFTNDEGTQRSMFGTPWSACCDFGIIQAVAETRATGLGWTGFRVVSIQVCQPDVTIF